MGGRKELVSKHYNKQTHLLSHRVSIIPPAVLHLQRAPSFHSRASPRYVARRRAYVNALVLSIRAVPVIS